MQLDSKDDAIELLRLLGAPRRLVIHAELVSEVARELTSCLQNFDIDLQKEFVEIGAVLHDAGKVLFPDELSVEGNQHEAAGEQLLLENGVAPEIARFCVSHAQFQDQAVSFEELLVALADKLWKGKRVPELELRIIDHIADNIGRERWSIFSEVDLIFEEIASSGHIRLEKSVH